MIKFFTALGKETELSRFEPHSFIAGENGVACIVELTATSSEDTAKIEKAWFGR